MKNFIKTSINIGAFKITIDSNYVFSHANEFLAITENALNLPNCSIVNYSPLQLLSPNSVVNYNLDLSSNRLVIETTYGKMYFTVMQDEPDDLAKSLINIYQNKNYQVQIDSSILAIIYDISKLVKPDVELLDDKIVCETVDFVTELNLREKTGLEIPLNTIIEYEPATLNIYVDDNKTILVGQFDDFTLYRLI